MTLPTSHNEARGEKQLVRTDLGQKEKKKSVVNGEPEKAEEGVGFGEGEDLAGAAIKINLKGFQVFRGRSFRGDWAAASEPEWVHTSGRTDARRTSREIRVALFTDLLIFLADVGLNQRVGNLRQVRCQQRPRAAVQHGGQHH